MVYGYAQDVARRDKDMLNGIIQGLKSLETIAFYLSSPMGQRLLDQIRALIEEAEAERERSGHVVGWLEMIIKVPQEHEPVGD